MAATYSHITPEQADLIGNAPLFFVASADPTLGAGSDGAVPDGIDSAGIGPVNLSPKGGVPLHIIGPNCVAWLDYAGSGNETARHAAAGAPVTLMVCSFDAADAAIVRLYGRASATPLDDYPHRERLLSRAAAEINLPVRQAIEVSVTATATSCGYGVPVLHPAGDRTRAQRGRRYKAG